MPSWTERLGQHLKYGVRALMQRPAFSVTTIATLGIGIGFVTAIFTIFYALSYRELRVRDASRLLNVYQLLHGNYSRNVHGVPSMVSYQEYLNYRAAIDSARARGGSVVSSVAVYAPTEFATDTRSATVHGEYVSCDYFSVVGARIERGRSFTPDECAHFDDLGAAATIVSHAMWTRDFASDPQIIGRHVRLNQIPMTVIGVAEPGYGGLTVLATSAWVPVTLQPTMDHGRDSAAVQDWSWMYMAARLAPGATIAQARAQLSVTARQRDAQLFPSRQTQVVVTKAALFNFPEARQRGGIVAAAIAALAALLVLMVCANIMNLQLARGIARRREIGIRLAIGASRARLIEQLFAESLLVALLGGALGFALAYGLPALLPVVVPIPDLQVNLSPDARVLALAFGVSVGTALVFGLLPALHATNLDLVSASRGAMTTRSGQVRTSRLRGFIVGVQVGGSALLLIVSALFIRAARHAATVDPGYTVDNVVSFRLNLAQLGYSPERTRLIHQALRDRIAAYPGVEAVGSVWPLPLLGRRQQTIHTLGGSQGAARELQGIPMASVTSGAFAALELKMRAGRAYTDADVKAAGTTWPAVVSQSLANSLASDGHAVGVPFRVEDRSYVVTGIAADARYTSLSAEREPFLYMPPVEIQAEELSLIVRTRGSSAQLERALPQWLQELDPNVVVNAQRLSERVSLELKPVRIASAIAAAAGMLAMLLALIGIYGVVTYAVSQQTRDIAIRQALGATRSRVVHMVLRQGSRPVVIALVVATLAGLGVAQLMRKLLYGVSPLDPLSYIVVLVLLIGASAAAMYAPARRATRISPAVALRDD